MSLLCPTSEELQDELRDHKRSVRFWGCESLELLKRRPKNWSDAFQAFGDLASAERTIGWYIDVKLQLARLCHA